MSRLHIEASSPYQLVCYGNHSVLVMGCGSTDELEFIEDRSKLLWGCERFDESLRGCSNGN